MINAWMEKYKEAVNREFGPRVRFIGLQGSQGRGEAHDGSDIDTVLILDEFDYEDLKHYRKLLDQLPEREKICGFVSGEKELKQWDKADLFQFYHDTKPILGSLDELLPQLDAAAVTRAIKIGAGNIYHGCMHNMLHERNEDVLRGLYKSAAFVVQAIEYIDSGCYIKHHHDLLNAASTENRAIIATCMHLKNGGDVDFDRMSGSLMTWASQQIEKQYC